MCVEQDKIIGKLSSALNDAQHDMDKVEFWASALTAFSTPVLEYDLDAQRKQLPHSI